MNALNGTSSPLLRYTPVKTPARQTLAEVAPQDTVTLSSTRASTPAPTWLHRVKSALFLACSLSGVASLAACSPAPPTAPRQANVQTAPVRSNGPRYEMTTPQVQQATRNTLTASELPQGARRLTPLGVDANQASKRYHDPVTLEVDEQHSGKKANVTNVFGECTSLKTDGTTCNTAKQNQISYTPLSCEYRDEADGQVYRVIHKSLEHRYTRPMDRMVCGGHELRYNNAEMAYYPHQTSKTGETLYLNPANIIQVLPRTAP